MCENLLGWHGHVIVKCTVDACNVPIHQWSIQRFTEAYNRQHSRKQKRLKKKSNRASNFETISEISLPRCSQARAPEILYLDSLPWVAFLAHKQSHRIIHTQNINNDI
ncbi:hypothetical protein NC652_021882 [Populus alba x Populus x berolinensis]|nr:hypothetical protein NC652_021882 [Populus alba x Populus x berolinensis]